MQVESRVHARNLVAWAAGKPEVLVLSADLTSSCEADLFRTACPDRFISCGIAEQNMLSVAGGLCREGFVPFVHTFGVFITRRAWDQVAMSVAYPNLPVKMFGFLPGITTPGGATHQAIDDVALMRLLPNMTVFEVGDATEIEGVLDAAYSVPGPVYVRMLRGDVPRLFAAGTPFGAGRPKIVRRGGDITVFSTGICTEEAMRATTALVTKGFSPTLVHVSTLKPFGGPEITCLIESSSAVVTMENHLVEGGLGSAVAGLMADNGIVRPLVRLGLHDTFSHGASRAILMAEHGIDAMGLIQAVERIAGTSFGISRSDLADVRIEPVHSDSKAEAL